MTRIEKDIFVRAKMSFSDDASLYSSFDTRSLEMVILNGEGYLCFDDTTTSEKYRYVCYKTSTSLAKEIFAAHRADEISYKATGTLTGRF